jgi:2-polyprenyl-3-methyl-5-hydroxy-6-metoxy-1,4-benzoquinol methylase
MRSFSITDPAPSGMQSCPYCGGAAIRHIDAPDYNRKTSTAVFRLDRCTVCDLRFVTNPPDDLAPYYTTDYHFVPDSVAALDPHLEAQRFKLDFLQRFKPAGSMLEIGPSTGMFCRLAQLAGYDVSAIEMDADCTRFLIGELGVRAVNSADPAGVLNSESRRYDAICLWHAIEHMPEPWRVLEAAAEHLEPGGALIVAAPNPHAWQARLLGRRWPHHDLPRHLFALAIPWLLEFARKHELTPELVTTRDEGSLYWNRFTWAMLARSGSQNSRVRARLWQLGIGLGYLLQPWEGREGKGATYTAVFRRSVTAERRRIEGHHGSN